MTDPAAAIARGSVTARDITGSGLGRFGSRAGFAVAAVAAVVGVGVVVAGCSQVGGESGAGGTSPAVGAQRWTPGMQTSARTPAQAATSLPPALAGVVRTDPLAVATAAMLIWFSWDPGTDSGPDDAAARAAPLLTPAYAQALTTGAPVSGPGADWARWRAQRARLVPSVQPGVEPVPPATQASALEQLEVSQAVTAPDGTVTAHESAVVDVTLTHRGDGWEVADVQQL